jgi:hypothetical protein
VGAPRESEAARADAAIAVQATLKDGHYIGESTVKLTDFGIKPPGKAGIKAKDEVRIQFEVRLAS